MVVFNRSADKVEQIVAEHGALSSSSIADLCQQLPSPRVVWLYLPAGEVTESHIKELSELLSPGDVIIDGGNSNFNITLGRSVELAKQGIKLIDVGTSGGIAGKEIGYCLMMGGEQETVENLNPLWQAVAIEGGYKRVGLTGAGHYTKMVHNAVEYGMMQSYGEGVQLLNAKPELSINIPEVAELWQHGSIIRSFLGQLLAEALEEDPELKNVTGFIEDNGEGKWAVEEALKQGIALPAITAALFARYDSRVSNTPAQKTISVLRNKFGGHRIV